MTERGRCFMNLIQNIPKNIFQLFLFLELTVCDWLQVQLSDSGVRDAAASEREAVLPRIRRSHGRQDGRGRLGVQHLHGSAQQRWLYCCGARRLFADLTNTNQTLKRLHRSGLWAGACSGYHGGRASHPEPAQTVVLRGRPAGHDHPSLLAAHQAVHGGTRAHQRGNEHVAH